MYADISRHGDFCANDDNSTNYSLAHARGVHVIILLILVRE